MVSWAPSRRARMERIETEAEAEALIRDLGDRAYHEARRREHEASSDAIAEEWALVARAVARHTGSRIGLNISTQLEMNTFFVMDREPGEGRESRSFAEAGSFAEDGPGPQPDRNDVPTPQPYRIQFLGAGTDAGQSLLREVEIRASDVSAAIIAAAAATWPPKTVALRILDLGGEMVFWREKAGRKTNRAG
jgi:hypothetical protein